MPLAKLLFVFFMANLFFLGSQQPQPQPQPQPFCITLSLSKKLFCGIDLSRSDARESLQRIVPGGHRLSVRGFDLDIEGDFFPQFNTFTTWDRRISTDFFPNSRKFGNSVTISPILARERIMIKELDTELSTFDNFHVWKERTANIENLERIITERGDIRSLSYRNGNFISVFIFKFGISSSATIMAVYENQERE